MTTKSREPLTTEQRSQIATLSAGGWSLNKISKHIGRSRHAVRNALADPEIQHAVKDEKAELAELYKGKARDCVAAIDADKISKSSALQLATAAGICTDKALLLAGEPTSINVVALLDVAHAIRAKQDADDQRLILEGKTTPVDEN